MLVEGFVVGGEVVGGDVVGGGGGGGAVVLGVDAGGDVVGDVLLVGVVVVANGTESAGLSSDGGVSTFPVRPFTAGNGLPYCGIAVSTAFM